VNHALLPLDVLSVKMDGSLHMINHIASRRSITALDLLENNMTMIARIGRVQSVIPIISGMKTKLNVPNALILY